MEYKTSYVERATQFIAKISRYLEGCSTIDDYCMMVDMFCHDSRRRVRCSHGLTRIALITSDYVVKIDIGSEYNCEQFGNCKSEYDFYKFAEKEDYDYLLAPITRIEYNNRYYYIMPYIHGVDTGKGDVDEYLSFDEAIWINTHLWDMHSGNYGFNDEGDPIIIDYACVRMMDGDIIRGQRANALFFLFTKN